jgi:hypothetical protein
LNDIRKMVATAYLTNRHFRVSYLVPHPDQDLELASSWQGATEGLVQTSHLLERAMTLPADIRELCSDWASVAMFRCIGLISHRIFPIEYSAFSEATRLDMWPPFRCVLSTVETADFVDAQIIENPGAWLHLSEVTGPGRIAIDSSTSKDVLAYVRRRVAQMMNSPERKLAEVCDAVLKGKQQAGKVVNLQSPRHNITRPNEIALEAFGCTLSDGRRGQTPGTEANAVRWVVKSFDFVARRRRELVPTSIAANSLILSVSASYRAFSNRNVIKQIARTGKNPKLIRHVLSALMKPRGYMLNFPGIDSLEGIINDRFVQSLIVMRQQELELYTAVLTRLSASALVPTLRLSPQINLATGLLKHLAECSRRPGPRKREKRLGLFKKIQTALNKGIDPAIRSRIDLLGARAQGVKLVSDLPLEWLHCNGLPLMLRHECSRIPLTPVSASFCIATDLDPVLISPAELADVLVIRSFSVGDPIRAVLEKGIDGFAQLTVRRPVSVRYVDVQTEPQLVDAINAHSGAMIIFDCHGQFDSDNYVASLVIGGEPVYLWTLRKKITRMPPIVVLSACDTAPIDGSHASAGASMLLLGAKTVLASFLPVDAIHAAVLIGRLIYRIAEFAPIALAYQPTVTWREIVAGMLKMSHLTESLMAIHREGHIDRDQYNKLHIDGNMDINRKRADWFDNLVTGLASVTGWNKSKALRILQTSAGLTDAMLYTQLGHPELVFLSELDEAQVEATVRNHGAPAAQAQVGWHI